MGPFGHRPGSSRDEAPKANDQAQGHNMEEDTKTNDQDGIALDGTTSTNGQWIYTLDGPWLPGPPAILDLTIYVEPPASHWSLACSRPGCHSWIFLEKTRLRPFQACWVCGQPWIKSFHDIGPQRNQWMTMFPGHAPCNVSPWIWTFNEECKKYIKQIQLKEYIYLFIHIFLYIYIYI